MGLNNIKLLFKTYSITASAAFVSLLMLNSVLIMPVDIENVRSQISRNVTTENNEAHTLAGAQRLSSPSQPFLVTNNEPFKGVSMWGYYTHMPEAWDYGDPPPANYYNESFRILSEAGLDLIRYLFTWESYEMNPYLFMSELRNVSELADKWGMKVMYANDQYHISSWLDNRSGYGFPSFLFDGRSEFPFGGGGASDNLTAAIWWSSWYNRTITNQADSKEVGDDDEWELQVDFLQKIVNLVDNRKSTLGYEILNEPQVYSEDQWEKIGKYNTFITQELRKSTDKIIAFDRQLPSDIGGRINAVPKNMAKMAPENLTNVIFKSTLYGLPTNCSYAEARLSTAANTAQLLGIPLWMGEFNIGITSSDPIADINQTEVELFVDKFNEAGVWGWSFWLWSYRHHPPNVKNYDLANVTEDGLVQPTKYFGYVKNVSTNYDNLLIFDSYPDNDKNYNNNDDADSTDSICPTITVTKIGGTLRDFDSSLSTSPSTPIELLAKSLPASIEIQGEAYDIATGLKAIEIKLGDVQEQQYQEKQNSLLLQNTTYSSPYNPVIQDIQEHGMSQWSASVITNNTGLHKIIVKATDNYDNVNYNTIYVNIVKNQYKAN